MHHLSGFKRDILYIVAGTGGLNGAEIKHRLCDYYDREIYDSQLYPNLDTLVERGLVDKHPVDGRTYAYQLTPEAQTVLKEHQRWKQHYTG